MPTNLTHGAVTGIRIPMRERLVLEPGSGTAREFEGNTEH